jgi:hypothetical protein
MILRNRTTRGQSVTEYAIVFSVVAAAIIGMQVFIKRGLQAKQRDVTLALTNVAGDPGLGAPIGTTKQYEPYYGESDYVIGDDSVTREEFQAGGPVKRTFVSGGTSRGGSAKTGVDVAADAGWQ